MKSFFATIVGAACLLCSTAIHATPYKLEFTASGFGPGIFGGATAPQNAVKGSILFTAPSVNGAISSIDGVDLTIFGHSYTADEIGTSPYSDGHTFGAKVNGVGVTRTNSDDFYLILSSNFDVFAFAVNGIADTWVTRSIVATYTDLTALPPPAGTVPEPGILALLGLGFGGLALARRNKMPQA